MIDHALIWATAMRRARTLHPEHIAAHITSSAASGLCATRYDRNGSRTTRIPCDDAEHCDDGPGEHSHLVHGDPTGNAAMRGINDPQSLDLIRLNRATAEFVVNARVVIDWVSHERPDNWTAVVSASARLMPGSVQAGLDLDDEHRLPYAIGRVDRAVDIVEAIATDHLPRTPTQDEQHWTAGLADEDCCVWHLSIHRRYRRPRLPGKNICQDCVSLASLLGQRPPQWLLEAEVDREGKPKAWTVALGRCMDELGIMREAG